MDFIEPNINEFTVYSRSDCIYCIRVKNLLKTKNIQFTVIDCDDYYIENKTDFLLFINKISNTEVKGFPMVFHNKKFIGGYNETKIYIEKLLAFDEEF
jgi:glutaredoxin